MSRYNAVSPSGEVQLSIPSRRRGKWRIKVRDLYREGRGIDAMEAAMLDLADALDRDGIGVPAGELRRLVRDANDERDREVAVDA